MTAAALGLLHIIAAILILLLLLVGLCIIAMVWLCAIFRPSANGYARRFRLPRNSTRRRTLIITPDHKHPDIVGDVSQAQWPKGRFPASRPNVVRGDAK